MPRIRAVGIVIKDDQVLLMHRRRDGREYFTFPGGGVEEGENVEEAVARELREETTVKIAIKRLLYHQFYDDGTEQYFYLCDWLSGVPRLDAKSPESQDLENNFYEPLWFKQIEAKELRLYPLEIRDIFFEDQAEGFRNCPKEMKIKISELKH